MISKPIYWLCEIVLAKRYMRSVGLLLLLGSTSIGSTSFTAGDEAVEGGVRAAPVAA